ncbi:class I SAM-dependent methyltransferase [Heliobacterium mobile]|uniref:class I SAM-dependent methyltransferase n=1 Tax=Heliobacterium mobile TaxID=28064 RepID=UPI0012D81E96|nr:class I SAM-dependent methyltransferase [Heliobacterium mobile]
MQKRTYQDLLALLGVNGAHPGGFLHTKRLLQKLQIQQNWTVLDAGCGSGLTSSYLVRAYGCAVTALDLNPLMIRNARRRFTQERLTVQLIQGDIEKLPLQNSAFDLIVAESVTVFTDIHKSLSEYARVLKPGGRLLDLEMTVESTLAGTELQELSQFYGMNNIPTESEWIQFFKQSGFTIESIEGASVSKTAGSLDVTNSHLDDIKDQELLRIWSKHQELTEKYAHTLGYRQFQASLPGND